MNENLLIAIEAALEAGNAIMERYNEGFTVEKKENNSPITEADLAANKIINDYLKDTGIPIISEEHKQEDYSIRKNWEKCWIVDPLDGTKEFIKRNDEFTVNIALLENKTLVLGIIYAPSLKLLYFTEVNRKTVHKVLVEEKQSVDDIIKRSNLITSSSRKRADNNVIRITGSRSHLDQNTKKNIEKIKKENKEVVFVPKGSSLKFCLIAEGNADIYPRFAPTMEWDTAAGQAICQALDIQVIATVNNQPLMYNKKNLKNSEFICQDLDI
jgi:3'(2'), 5'-bisphosphate nucleotidase